MNRIDLGFLSRYNVRNWIITGVILMNAIGTRPALVYATEGQCGPGTSDIDCDGVSNVSDPDADGDGINNVYDSDDDNDGTPDSSDSSPGGAGTSQENWPTQWGGSCTTCCADNDDDCDGTPNPTDPDSDGDGIANNIDTDDDNDGTVDEDDPTPGGSGTNKCDWGNDCTNCWSDIEVLYKTFIQCEVIRDPFSSQVWWGGDGRSFNYTSNQFRTKNRIVITDNPEHSTGIISPFAPAVGISKAFDANDVIPLGPGDCAWGLGANPTVNNSCQHNLPDSNLLDMFIESTPDSCERKLKIKVHANNCLLPGSSAIDALYDLFIKTFPDGTLKYKIVGDHDGFPWHEFYLNGNNRVHSHNPAVTGEGLLSLFPPMDHHVDTGWLPMP